MRTPPSLTESFRYPVIAGTSLLAIGVTLAFWAKVDITPLFATAMIRRGEYWRLVTSILPHGGILHLIFNLYWLWVFGSLVEEVFGHLKTAALIILVAIVSSAMEFAFASGGIGLSGVGYGFFGLLWILSGRDERFRDAVDRKTVELFIGWFFFCIVATMLNFMQIANIAHGAGALVGILTGLAISHPNRRALATFGVSALVAFGLWGATVGRPRMNLSSDTGYDEGKWAFEALTSGRPREAVRWFSDAVQYQPKSGIYWYDLAIALDETGNSQAALSAYRKGAELGNASAQYYVGTLYEKGDRAVSKDEEQALLWYQKAAEQNHTDALNNLAWAYATSTDPAIRNPGKALEFAQRAVKLEKDQPRANDLDTLAEAYYVNGKYEDALKTEQQAITLAPDEEKAEFHQRCQKYERALSNVQTRSSAK